MTKVGGRNDKRRGRNDMGVGVGQGASGYRRRGSWRRERIPPFGRNDKRGRSE